MTLNLRTRYDAYALQRINQTLVDLQARYQDLHWSSMADRISERRGIRFQRINFYRLRDGELNDANINIIVDWIEDQFDKEFRSKLLPESIFREFGVSARDYYYHLPAINDLDDWSEQVLDQFSGVYLCAPAIDINSFLPTSFLRRYFDDPKSYSHLEMKNRSVDIKQYINERTLLILKRTSGYYFHAAEFPLSVLFPRTFPTLDIKMIYEGIGVASANSLNINLRECLSHVPKTLSILISRKNRNQTQNPHGLSLYLPPGKERVREEWKALPPEDRAHMNQEYAPTIEADHFLSGSAQISVSPVAFIKNRVEITFPRELVFYRKPLDFLRNKEVHFIRPELENSAEIKKLIENPLAIVELL